MFYYINCGSTLICFKSKNEFKVKVHNTYIIANENPINVAFNIFVSLSIASSFFNHHRYVICIHADAGNKIAYCKGS